MQNGENDINFKIQGDTFGIHYDGLRLCFVKSYELPTEGLSIKAMKGQYRIDTNLVENGQRPVALSRNNYLFCKNHDAAEDAAVMYTMMGCCKLAGVNVELWLTYFLDHVHEYDNDYSRDIAELLPAALNEKGLLKFPVVLQRTTDIL